jgi:hypothetical protein
LEYNENAKATVITESEKKVMDSTKENHSSNDVKKEFVEYEIDFQNDEGVKKEVHKLIVKYVIEIEQEDYSVERHFLALQGTGSNNKWDSVEVDIDFEYPKLVNYKDSYVESEINKKLFASFFYKDSIQELSENDPFNSYNRYEYGNYEVKYSDENYLSFLAMTSYSEGTSPATSYSGFTININAGTFIRLSDLVTVHYILEKIESGNYELDGTVVGIHGNKFTDEVVKSDMINYITSVYDFSEEQVITHSAMNYAENGYYVDGDYIYIYIHLLESYGRDLFLKVPFEINTDNKIRTTGTI